MNLEVSIVVLVRWNCSNSKRSRAVVDLQSTTVFRFWLKLLVV